MQHVVRTNHKMLINSSISFEENYLFWQKKFIKHQAYRITHRHIKEENRAEIQRTLENILNIESLEALSKTVNRLKNLGLRDVHSFIHSKFLIFIKEKHPNIKLYEVDTIILNDFFSILAFKHTAGTLTYYKAKFLSLFRFIEKNTYFRFLIDIKLNNDFKNSLTSILPSFLNENELKILLNELNSYTQPKKIKKLREALMLKIIIFTGLRIAEVVEMKFENIIQKDNYYLIEVIGKGNKLRRVSILKTQIDNLLLPFLKLRASYKQDNPYIFTTKMSNFHININRQNVVLNGFLKAILYKLKIEKERNSVHMLRHSFASFIYKQSKDMILVRDSLGHSQTSTSHIYMHLDEEKLLEISQITNKLLESPLQQNYVKAKKCENITQTIKSFMQEIPQNPSIKIKRKTQNNIPVMQDNVMQDKLNCNTSYFTCYNDKHIVYRF